MSAIQRTHSDCSCRQKLACAAGASSAAGSRECAIRRSKVRAAAAASAAQASRPKPASAPPHAPVHRLGAFTTQQIDDGCE